MINFVPKRIQEIKKAQKEKLFFREISQLLLQLTFDNPALRDLIISRISLSDDKSVCTVYFYTAQGLEQFKQKLELLKLYKPSLRKAIADTIKGRYTPELLFKFDEQYEKGEKISQLLEKIKTEDSD